MANGYYRVSAGNDDTEARNASTNNPAQTYALIGTDGGGNDDCRTFLRFQMDIPRGAVIDKAHLYVWSDALLGSPSPIVSLVDSDSCPDFSTNPYSYSTVGSISWGTISGTARWLTSPDVKDLVQAYVNRPGYVQNYYIGLSLRESSPTSSKYWRSVQYDWASNVGYRAAMLLVAWHHDWLGKGCNYWEVAASTDDTYNQSDDAGDKTAIVNGRFGQVENANKETTDEYSRVAFRWATTSIPAYATINNALIVVSNISTNTTAAQAQIGAMTSCDAFSSGEYAAMATFIGSAYTWNPVETFAGQTQRLFATPDIAAQVSNRVSDGSYNPAGSDPANYIAIAIKDNGDLNNASANRDISFYDHTTMVAPILVAYYDIQKKPPGQPTGTGSFMMC